MIEYLKVETHEHGLLVVGTLNVSMMGMIDVAAKATGYGLIDAGIGSAMGHQHPEPIVLALVSETSGPRWREEIAAALAKVHPPLKAWQLGCDTGASSLTIAKVLFGMRPAAGLGMTPSDAWDFMRCSKLLDLSPGSRERLGVVAETFPEWAPIVARWADLEAALVLDVADEAAYQKRKRKGAKREPSRVTALLQALR